MIRKSKGHIAPLSGEDIDEHAKAVGTTRHLIEQNRRSIVGRDHNIGCEPDLLLPRRSANGLKLTQLFSFAYPSAKVGKGNTRLKLTVRHDRSLSHNLYKVA